MVLVGSGSVSFDTDPDPAIFLYGSGSREMIRISRIRIRQTGPDTLFWPNQYGGVTAELLLAGAEPFGPALYFTL